MTVHGVREGLGSGEQAGPDGDPASQTGRVPEGKGATPFPLLLEREWSGMWWGHGTALCPEPAASPTPYSRANRGGRKEAKPQAQPEHSPRTPLLSLQARVGSSPTPVFREGARSSLAVCPSLLPHSGCVPDVPGLKANAGATGRTLRCWWHPDSSRSYPPAPLNLFHPLAPQPAPRGC